jgi:hypothetical protein
MIFKKYTIQFKIYEQKSTMKKSKEPEVKKGFFVKLFGA